MPSSSLLWRRGRSYAVAVLLPFLAAGRAAAQPTPLDPGQWVRFGWFDGVGPVDDPFDGFFLAVLQTTRVRVVDAFVVGERFDLLVDGIGRLTTSAVAAGDVGFDTGIADADVAWNEARLSRGELLLDPGTYRLDLVVRDLAPGGDLGDAFIRADLVAPTTTAPEPATLALLAGGLAGLAAVRRTRSGPTTARVLRGEG